MSNEKLGSILSVTARELDGEGPTDTEWVAIDGFSSFLALVLRTVGTGGLDEFKILGNTLADGSGTDVELADYADVGTLSAVDAVDDQAMLEITQADLDAANSSGTPLLGISVSLGHVTATDESIIVYVMGAARTKYALKTAQNVLA